MSRPPRLAFPPSSPATQKRFRVPDVKPSPRAERPPSPWRWPPGWGPDPNEPPEAGKTNSGETGPAGTADAEATDAIGDAAAEEQASSQGRPPSLRGRRVGAVGRVFRPSRGVTFCAG